MCSVPPQKDSAGIPMSQKENVHPNTTVDSGWLPSRALLKVPIRPDEEELFERINIKVRDFMSGPQYDSSHNCEHIQRVVNNANNLLKAESETNKMLLDTVHPLAIFLGCLTHDIGDHKYLEELEDPDIIIAKMLMECGCPQELVGKVQLIALTMSYSKECANPERVQEVLSKHPELAFVQDADRLDAMGVIGMGRCFTFGGANKDRRTATIHWTLQYQSEKLVHLPRMMKTTAGRKEGGKRWERLCEFRRQWEEETDVSAVLK